MPKFFISKLSDLTKRENKDYRQELTQLYSGFPSIDFASWYQENYPTQQPLRALSIFKSSPVFQEFKRQMECLIDQFDQWSQTQGLTQSERNRWNRFGRYVFLEEYISSVTQLDMYGKGKTILEALCCELLNPTDNNDANNKTKQILFDLIKEDQLGKCASGVYTHLENAYAQLHGHWIRDFVNQFAQEFLHLDKRLRKKAHDIHYVNALFNYVAPEMGMTVVPDEYAPQHLSPSFLEKFRKALGKTIDSPALLSILANAAKEKFIQVKKGKHFEDLLHYLNHFGIDESFRLGHFYHVNENNDYDLQLDHTLDFKIKQTLLKRLIHSNHINQEAYITIILRIQDEEKETLWVRSRWPMIENGDLVQLDGKILFPLIEQEIAHPAVDREILFLVNEPESASIQTKQGMQYEPAQSLMDYLQSDDLDENKVHALDAILSRLNKKQWFSIKQLLKKSLSSVIALLEKGMPIDQLLKPESQKAILLIAAEEGSLTVVHAIIENHKELLNESDCFHQTALLWAATNGHRDIFAYLLQQKGIEIKAASFHNAFHKDNNKTALDWAIQNGHVEIVKTLLALDMNHEDLRERPALFKKKSLIHLAAEQGNAEIMHALLSKYPNQLNRLDYSGRTPLMNAAANGHIDVVGYLLKQKGVVFSYGLPYKTIFSWALEQGDLKLLKHLLIIHKTKMPQGIFVDLSHQKSLSTLTQALHDLSHHQLSDAYRVIHDPIFISRTEVLKRWIRCPYKNSPVLIPSLWKIADPLSATILDILLKTEEMQQEKKDPMMKSVMSVTLDFLQNLKRSRLKLSPEIIKKLDHDIHAKSACASLFELFKISDSVNEYQWKGLIRKKAYDLLQKEITQLKTADEKIHHLSSWKNKSLFAEHRNGFSALLGIFGFKTKTQKKLEKQIAGIKKEKKRNEMLN